MPKILIVEDNEMNRDMLSRRLARKGFAVTSAADGAECLRAVVEDRPDLVLMDLSLPVIDGWEATRRLKADAATRDIPVIALTAHVMSTDREKALAAGCDGFATKPIDLPALLATMAALLGGCGVKTQAQERPVKAKDPVRIDLARMREVAEGCGWSLLELTDFYAPRARRELAAIESAHAGNDWEAVAQLAHGAAGSSATIGLPSLSELYRGISRHAPAAPDSPLADMLAEANEHLARALMRLEELARTEM